MARHVARGGDEGPRTVWMATLVLWVLVIWVHSLIPGPASTDESMTFVRLITPLLNILHVDDLDLVHTVVRKGAHLSEYFVLAMLSVVALRPRLAVPLWPAVMHALLCVAVPCIDELVIQVRVPGRDGSVRDVLIDMAGFALGTLIAVAVRRAVDRRRRRAWLLEQREREERAARYVRRARRRTRERAERAAFEARHQDAQQGQSGRPPAHLS